MDSPTTSRSQATSSSTTLSLNQSSTMSFPRGSPRPDLLARSYSALSSPTMASKATDPATDLFQQKLRERKEELQRQGRLGDDHDRNADTASIRYGPKSNGSRATSAQRKPSGQMGLREQEQHVSKLDKQNFDLKLKIYHQDKRLDELLVELEKRDEEEKEMQKIIDEQQRELERRDQSLRQAVDAILLMDDQIRRLRKMLQGGSELTSSLGFTADIPESSVMTTGESAVESTLPEDLRHYAQQATESHKLVTPKPSREALAAPDSLLRSSSAMSRATNDSRYAADRLTMKSPAFSVLSEGELESVYAWKEELRRGAAPPVDTQSEADLTDRGRNDILDPDFALPSRETEEAAPTDLTHEQHPVSPDPYAESAIVDDDDDDDWALEHEDESMNAAAPVRPELARALTSDALVPRPYTTPHTSTSSPSASSALGPRRPAIEHSPPRSRRARPLPPLPYVELLRSSAAAATHDHGGGNSASAPTSAVPSRAPALVSAFSATSSSPSPVPASHSPATPTGIDAALARPMPPPQPQMLHEPRATRRPPLSGAPRRPRPLSLSAKEEQLLKYIDGIDDEFYIRGPREMMLAAGMFTSTYAGEMPPTPPDTLGAGASSGGGTPGGRQDGSRPEGARPRVAFGPTEVYVPPPPPPAELAAQQQSSRRGISFLRGRRLSWARGGTKDADGGASGGGAGAGTGKGPRVAGPPPLAFRSVSSSRAGAAGNVGTDEGAADGAAAAATRVRRDSDSSAGGEKDAVAGPKRRRWSFKGLGGRR